MRLRARLFISTALISLVPIVLITIITYTRYAELIKGQTVQVAAGIFNQATSELNTSLEKIDQIYQMFMLYSIDGTSVLDDIEKYAGDEMFDDYDVLQSSRKLQFICQSAFYFNKDVNGVFLFTPSGVTLGYGYGGNTDVYYDYDPREDLWYKSTLSLNGGLYIDGISRKNFIIGARHSVSFCRAIYTPFSRKLLGILVVDCAPEIFDLTAINALPNLVQLTVENTDTGSTFFPTADKHPSDYDADSLRLNKTTLRYENLVLTAAVDYHKLYQQFDSTQRMVLIIGLIAIAAIVLFSFLISRNMAKPILNISRAMADRSGHNRITDQKLLNRRDETGILCKEYNMLLDELQRIAVREFEHKLIMLDAQMRSLEAQIDSHFLYNTLESINSIAEIKKVSSIATISQALGNMFRYRIKTKSELVRVAEELDHVGDYVSIQKIRYDNAFVLELDLPETLSEMKILKLIIQPLVENALKHGLRNCQMGDRIRIMGHADEKHITLCVEDNGVGMSKEQLSALRDELSREPRFSELGQRDALGIGLKNIHSRIELYYGKGYGLSLSSSSGKGTSVTILVPRHPPRLSG